MTPDTPISKSTPIQMGTACAVGLAIVSGMFYLSDTRSMISSEMASIKVSQAAMGSEVKHMSQALAEFKLDLKGYATMATVNTLKEDINKLQLAVEELRKAK